MSVKKIFLGLWLFPILIALCFEICFSDFKFYRLWNVLENLLFAFGMLLTLTFFNKKKIKVFLVNAYFLILVFSLFFETVFFYLFGANMSASTIFILLQTNNDEAMEFLRFYGNIKVLVFFVLLLVGSYFYLKLPKTKIFVKRNVRTKTYVAVFFIGLLVLMKFSGLIDPNLPYLIGRSVINYHHEQQKMEKMGIGGAIGNFQEVEHTAKTDQALYVIVIGESTNRGHLGLYGYYRNTTPKLKEIENDLLIYNKVISSHAYTIGALKDVLTWHGFKKEKESSVVQLMNQAGFKTYWLSNQRPLGPYESLVTEISKSAEQVHYTNMEIDGWHTPYDEVLLPYLDKSLADIADKKFIVLHILGTHIKYKNRYPDKWNYFTEKPRGRYTDKKAKMRINAYDNAVRYMDNFLRKVIEKVRKQNKSSYVLYFSDHGEEVYDVRYFSGHNEANPTRNMFEIPFFLWRSEKFKKENSIFIGNLNQPYKMDSFIYSLSDLSQINFNGMNSLKSIFSKKFKPHKRVVGEGIDFDLEFKE